MFEETEDQKYRLTIGGQIVLAKLIVALIERGYDLIPNEPSSLWQAASFLVAQDYSDLPVDATAVMLTFAVDSFARVKEELEELE